VHLHVGSELASGERESAARRMHTLRSNAGFLCALDLMALAGELGLDQTKALEALMSGAAASFMLGDRGPRAIQAYAGEDAEVKSRLDIFVKDMGIVNSAARSAGLATPVAGAAEQLFLLGLAQGKGAADDSSVITVVAPTKKKG
jgi:3-hydroxyisobutyrate dehydrogenase